MPYFPSCKCYAPTQVLYQGAFINVSSGNGFQTYVSDGTKMYTFVRPGLAEMQFQQVSKFVQFNEKKARL